MTRDDIDLEAHLGISADRLDTDIRRRLGEFVASRERRLVELRERAIEAEQEVKVLEQRIEALQNQLASVDTGGGDQELPGITLEPATLVSTFGEALQSEQVQDSGFIVSSIDVDLRANVVSTGEGVRVNLLEPGVQASVGSLSELRFSVRADSSTPEFDLDEVPDLIGLTEETARQTLSNAGFEIGTVESVPADAAPGRVVDQLPSPFSLAESGAAVDLEVAEEQPPKMVDLVGQSLDEAVQFVGERFSLRDITSVESEKPPGTIIKQDPAPGDEIDERDELAFTISAFRSPEPSRDEQADEGDEVNGDEDSSGTPEESARREDEESSEAPDEELSEVSEGGVRDRLDARLREAIEVEAEEGKAPLGEHDVTEINGIGETYGQRLRDAGVESLADLAVAEPFEVADAANVSRDRARGWIDSVHTHLRSVAESNRGSSQRDDEDE